MPASSTQDVVVPDVGYSFSLSSVERPTLQRSQVADLVQQHWGLQVLSVHELGSYEDRNYLVECGEKLQPHVTLSTTSACGIAVA